MPANNLHPVYHSHSNLLGSRIDVARPLPAELTDANSQEVLDLLGDAPKYAERISPVSTIINNEVIRGKNWTEMMIRSYRVFLRLFSSIAGFMRQTQAERFGERAPVPFMSIDLEPDVFHRILELDYEQGENTYGLFLEMFRNGAASPVISPPFHALLPVLPTDFDRRLVIRSSFMFYGRILREYHKFLRANHGEAQFIAPFWLPECAANESIVRMIHEELHTFARQHRIADPHLLLVLDNQQVIGRDTDVMMKAWNFIKVGDKGTASLLFRDRAFSDWTVYSNPSVKKLIDRTIAKVDSELNEQKVDYCWAHYEDIETLAMNSKSAMNFEQKVVKITQLSYMPVAPDVFVRRKLNRRFGRQRYEPLEVRLRNNTSATDWHPRATLGRWVGVLDSNAEFPLVDESRPYSRRTRTGRVQEMGPQCWKIALTEARRRVAAAVMGDPENPTDGLCGILASICGAKDPKIARRNVQEFLVAYTLVHWREHFLQQDMSETDCSIEEIADTHLVRDCKRRLKTRDYVLAAAAARAYYFALDSFRSQGTQHENMDQRAVYQTVAMLNLSAVYYIHILHWTKEPAKARVIVDLLKTELIDFGTAFGRYTLADYGVTPFEWEEAMKSAVDESPRNIVDRCTRRVLARHLRPLGYKKDFSKEDEEMTTNCGHIWTAELELANYKWENKIFCGLREE